MNEKYISWIPNTSGMLLYSLVEAFDYRSDRIVGDVFEIRESNSSVIHKHHKEPFLISMLIDLRDYAGNSNKYTRVIFTANPIDGNKLNGSIYFLDHLEKPGLYKDIEESSLIKELSSSVKKEAWDGILSTLINYYKKSDIFYTRIYS